MYWLTILQWFTWESIRNQLNTLIGSSLRVFLVDNYTKTSKIPGIKEVNIIFYIEMILEYAVIEILNLVKWRRWLQENDQYHKRLPTISTKIAILH